LYTCREKETEMRQQEGRDVVALRGRVRGPFSQSENRNASARRERCGGCKRKSEGTILTVLCS